MSYTFNQCEAHEYGRCEGYTKDVNVIYKYRYKTGGTMPDESVNVTLCSHHLRWLNKVHEGKQIEMRGESVKEATELDLFWPFDNKDKMYTLLEAESYDVPSTVRSHKYFLINGRNTNDFRKLLRSSDMGVGNARIHEVGFYQTYLETIVKEDGNLDFIDAVAEVETISGELPLEAMVSGLTSFYKQISKWDIRNISNTEIQWFTRDEKYPTLDTEYSMQPIPEFVRDYFFKKQEKAKYDYFEECCEFIADNIDSNIVNWTDIRKKSPHLTMVSLFDTVNKVTEALLHEDGIEANIIISDIIDEEKLTADVLFVTYVMANHELYCSEDPKKSLRKNAWLIQLFISSGLEKDLLALAIAGERERMLSRKQRDHHDILETNLFVVEYLMPKYIRGSEIVYNSDNEDLTPLGYWHYYNNTTSYIGGGFCSGQNNVDIFEKDQSIFEYLVKNTPLYIIDEVNKSLNPTNSELGGLDKSLLSGAELEMYEKVVVQKGESEAEFIISGFPEMFQKVYFSTTTYTWRTIEDTEKLFPGITDMYEQKKSDLRKNKYDAWAFVNNKLRKQHLANL
jgi:hypothetical protein